MSQRDIVVDDEVSGFGRRLTMQEVEWLTSTRAEAMMRFLMTTRTPRWVADSMVPLSSDALISDRKLRLVVCACARGALPGIGDQRIRDAVWVAERYADGVADLGDLFYANQCAYEVCQRIESSTPPWIGYYVSDNRNEGWRETCLVTMPVVAHHFPNVPQANLIREIVGNPWHSWTDPRLATPRMDHLPPAQCSQVGWLDLRWLTNDVMGIAHDAWYNQRFDLLPVLADALDDANFPFTIVQDHLRSHLPHARGCWALDLIMAKQ